MLFLSMPPGIWAAVILYALMVGATLTLAARRGPRWMWLGGGAIVLVAVGIAHAHGAVPIYTNDRALCRHG